MSNFILEIFNHKSFILCKTSGTTGDPKVIKLEKKSLLNEFNRNEISLFLEKNYNRNYLNINFWNKKLFIDDYSNNINNDFEKSFLNLFLLTKNNEAKNFELKKYFIFNYDYFTEKNKKIVMDNY